ncbi:LPXTG cell wall anchor domain-containing protein [Agrococcus baldri]|uniref:LPXTG cell wall anchor domain-containing protein n=1 Tax=Agrococcus baldri TaxID=153730 RepID=UPI00296FB89B|nr:LPXTG cell wall anchor domain-containing protein [Agrococcus baldri]
MVCSITNDDSPAHLTLLKRLVADNGGSAVDTDFTLTATGPTSLSGVEGSAAVTNVAVSAGTYTLGEVAVAGWALTGIACWSDANGQQPISILNAQIELSNGDRAYCELTNDDQAGSLTLIKNVIVGDGGTATASDWTLSAAGPTPGISGAGGVAAVPVIPGDYVLSESAGPAGYAASEWVCDGAFDPATDTVTVPRGVHVTCTITNDDIAPRLTLRKVVVNDDGGNAADVGWTLTAAGPTVGVTGTHGADAITNRAVRAGVYQLSESGGPTGYTASGWVCDGGALQGGALTLGVGDEATCTIENNDAPVDLALDKDDGGAIAGPGAQFDYTITVTNVGDRDVDGGEPVTVTDQLPAGLTYVSGPAGCAASGQTVTCSVNPLALTAGASVVLVLKVSVNADAEPGVRVNLATVTTEDDLAPTDGTCETDTNNIDCEETPLVSGSLAAEKSVFEWVNGGWVASDGVVDYGNTVQYRVVVTAGGTAATTGVVVTDTLRDGLMPDGLATCSVTCTATLNGLVHRIEIASMAPGEMVTITFTAKVPAAPAHAPGTTVSDVFANTAAVAGDGSPETPTNTVTVSATHVLPVPGVVTPPTVVTPPGVTAPTPTLPRTGGELPMSMIAAGLALLAAGGLLLVRRRERDA